MKLTRHKNSILIFCVLNILQVFCVPDNSHLSKGDQCKLENNQIGICKEAKSCEYALNLVKQRRTNEVSRCQFQGRIPIVCCPQDRPAPGPEPSYPKSKKFLTAICSDNSTRIVLNQNIVGGEPAGVGEFPFQVALGYTNQDGKVEYKCGGSLIADNIILTAAHCANRADVVPNTVKLGRVSLIPDEYDYGDGEDIEIESIKLHPKYSRFSRHNDIAIIKMKQPTKFSWPIETICLSQENHVLPKNLTITGYGRNDVDTLKTSDWLLRATVNIHPFQQCNEIFQRSGKPLVETQFCAAGYKGADACQGDSGGPVSYTITGIPYLYGVVSYGMGCGSEIPGIYTKVNQYLEWIDDEMYKIEQK